MRMDSLQESLGSAHFRLSTDDKTIQSATVFLLDHMTLEDMSLLF